MNPAERESKRRLVPRWRSLATTIKSGELASPMPRTEVRAPDEILPRPSDFLHRLERWNLSPSLVTAAELVESGIVEGREKDAVDAARRLVSIDKNAAPLIREQAAKLLERMGSGRDIPSDLKTGPVAIKGARDFIRVNLRDPLGWVELALAQTVRGASAAAERSMSVALKLAPDNRHVLRSAARLFLHRDDPERAIRTIGGSAATPTDPWLMASEIALAQVAGKSSRFLKRGAAVLAAGGYHPRQITELAGAVGTEELVNGNRRKSRRWFTQSMVDPTGSALAQGEWATASLGDGLISEDQLLAAFENEEALAFHLFRHRRFGAVKHACSQWALNDPFSVRPFEFGTLSAGYANDFEAALAFARRGLEMKPDSAFLLNALAFSAASLGILAEATEAVSKINPASTDRPQRLVAIANQGLIAFRQGNEGVARLFYAEAIDGFRRDGAFESVARAKIYLAREAMLAGTADWRTLLKDAHLSMAKFKDSPAISYLMLVEEDAAKRAAIEDSKRLNGGGSSKIGSPPFLALR